MRQRLVSTREWEDLSAYLDGQLNPKQSLHIELQLKERPELQEALEELRRTQAVLRVQGILRSPRNFTLTPEMVGFKAGRRYTWKPDFGLYPVLKFSSTLASALFMIVIIAHFLIAGPINQTAGVAMKPASKEMFVETPVALQPEATIAAEALDQFATTPPPSANREIPPEANQLLLPSAEGGVGGMGSQFPEPTSPLSIAVAAPQVSITESFSATLMSSIPTPTIAGEVAAKAVPAYPEPLPTEPKLATEPVTYPEPEVMKIQKPGLGGNPWFWAEIGLGVLAIGTGLAAFVLRRRGG